MVEYEVIRKEFSSNKTRKIATAFISRFLKKPPANLKHSISVPARTTRTGNDCIYWWTQKICILLAMNNIKETNHFNHKTHSLNSIC